MPQPADALLLIATGCSHCPAALEHLGKLVKSGALSQLEVINISNRPETAAAYQVKSVPWYRIGEFEFSGLMDYPELSDFVTRLNQGQGYSAYLIHLLENRQLDQAIKQLQEAPLHIVDLVPLLGDLNTPMALRIGIGALIEELGGSSALEYAIGPLQQLTRSRDPQVRADACHYLGICADPDSIPVIRALLDDDDPEVSEIAAETLDLLHDNP